MVAALNQGSWAGDQGTEKYYNGRALYQGSVDSHSRGARARQGVQLWLSQGSAVAVAIGAGGSGWCGSGDGGPGSCRRWRCSEQPAVVAGAGRRSDGCSGCEQVRLARAAVAQGTGCGSRAVERLGKPGLRTAGEGRDEVTFKKPTPPSFYRGAR